MNNQENLINFINSINKSINNNCGSSVQSHNFLQDKMIVLQEEFENLLQEIEIHNENYPNA